METMMNTSTIVSELKERLDPEAIKQMSQSLGVPPSNTSSAISLALPILLESLSKNTSSPAGAASLDKALGDHDGSILDNLGGVIGASGGGMGAAILRHILGSRREPVEQGVGRATGMNPQQVAQLLMMLAPLVMGVLGRMKRQRGIEAQQLPDVLGQGKADIEREAPATAGLGRILDQNNDGKIADDLARLGAQIFGR